MTETAETSEQQPAPAPSPPTASTTAELAALWRVQNANQLMFVILACALDDSNLDRITNSLSSMRDLAESKRDRSRQDKAFHEAFSNVLTAIEQVRNGRRRPAS